MQGLITEPNALHLVPFRTAGMSLPLYCFPGAGGEIGVFAEMASLMPDDQPIYAIDLHRFCETHNYFTIEQLAEFYLALLRKNQQKGPYYLCGFSFGGAVAYEIATLLANDGEDIGLLALIDATNPAFVSNLPPAKATEFRKTYLIDRLGKYGRNLLNGNVRTFAMDALAFLGPKLGTIPWWLIRQTFRVANRPLPPLLQNNQPTFRAALRNYVPKPYSKRLVVFRSEARGPEYDIDPTLGWSTCAIGGIDVHVVQGDHVNLMVKPQFLVNKLKAYLNHTP